MRYDIDDRDRVILEILVADATASKAEIARRLGLTPTAVFERIRKLEREGVIRGYEARLDPVAFGLPVVAYVFVTEVKPIQGVGTGQQLAEVANVEEVHRIAGEDCFLVKLRVESTAELARVLDRFAAIPSVGGTRTTIVLDTVAEGQTSTLCLRVDKPPD